MIIIGSVNLVDFSVRLSAGLSYVLSQYFTERFHHFIPGCVSFDQLQFSSVFTKKKKSSSRVFFSPGTMYNLLMRVMYDTSHFNTTPGNVVFKTVVNRLSKCNKDFRIASGLYHVQQLCYNPKRDIVTFRKSMNIIGFPVVPETA